MDDRWYADGLRFECKRCGDCCRGEPGFVWVGFDEAKKIAQWKGMSFSDFERAFLRRVGRRMSLIEKENGDCVFWSAGIGCSIYSIRPTQCRSFPFWPGNLESLQTWQREAGRCRGINSGRLYTADEIADIEGE